jgi:hypothetical protein
MSYPRKTKDVALVTLAAVLCTASTAFADRVSGRITSTYMLVEDTDLVGDVSCDVDNAPCFSFGARGIELRLNGFTITGRADAQTGCNGASFPNETGVFTNRQANVTVRGPGLIQRTRGRGVHVIGSTGARVQGFAISTTCSSGVFVAADSFNTTVEEIIAVRNGASAPGNPCGGI